MSSNRPRPVRRVATLALGAALLSPMVTLTAGPLTAEMGGPLALLAPAPAHAADATLAGSVTEAGSPVSRVLVSAYRWDESAERYVFEQETESLVDGTWELQFLPDGAYTLQFDTASSSAQFALGESLGGHTNYADDSPSIQITGGAVASTDVTAHDLIRLGGAVTLSVSQGGATLTDLEDAVAELRGVNAAGEPVTSRRYFASENGELTIARVPAGGFIPWLGAAGSQLAPAAADLLVTAGQVTKAGALELGEAPKDAVTGAAPTLSGDAQVGSELSVSVEVTPAAKLSYRWSTASGTALKSTGSSLALNDTLAGERVQAWVFARAEGSVPYVGVAVSDPIAEAGAQAGGSSASGGSAGSASSAGAAEAGANGTSSTAGSAEAAATASTAGAPGSANASANGSGASGGLATTGAAAMPWLGALGALLLAAGAALFVRKRAGRKAADTTDSE